MCVGDGDRRGCSRFLNRLIVRHSIPTPTHDQPSVTRTRWSPLPGREDGEVVDAEVVDAEVVEDDAPADEPTTPNDEVDCGREETYPPGVLAIAHINGIFHAAGKHYKPHLENQFDVRFDLYKDRADIMTYYEH